MYSDRLPYRSERDSDAYLRRSKVRRDDSSRSASPRKSKVGREEYYYDHQEASRATQEHRQETNRYSRTSHPPSDRRSSKDDKWRSSKDDRVDEFGRRGDRSTSRTPSHDERETHHRKGDNWRSSKDDNWRPSKDDRVDEYGRRGDRSTGRAHPHDERETHHRKDDNWRSSKVDWRSSKDDRVDKYRRRGERSTGRAPPRDERETHHRRYNDKNLKEYSEQRRRWEDDDARGREPVERNYHYGTSKPSREPRHRPHRSLSEQRRDLGIVSVVPDVDIAPIKRFSDEHSIPEYALDALRRHEKLAPYPIQAQVIPLAARGMNITGIARTGSGKTLAFLLPGLRYCTMPECRTVAALCMNPTRELAQQTYVEMNLLTASEEKSYNYRTKEYVPKSHVFKSAVMYGGIKKDDQRWDAQGCRFIAATPGRLLDFLREDDPCVDLSRLKYFVLDEADMMINVGFGPEIKSVCDFFEDSRPQVLFFSATWPQSIVESARNMMNDVAKPGVPIMVSMGADETPTVNANIAQTVHVFDKKREFWKYERHDTEKFEHLLKFLNDIFSEDNEDWAKQGKQPKILIFASTKKVCHDIANDLWEKGIMADSITGDKKQEQRLSTVERFKNGKLRCLVATDVVGRGIDFPECSHVILFHFPSEMETYVHRIGRTARGEGAKGCAILYYDYYSGAPQVPAELVSVLREAGQIVPEELQNIMNEVEKKGDYRGDWDNWKSGEKSRNSGRDWSTSTWEENKETMNVAAVSKSATTTTSMGTQQPADVPMMVVERKRSRNDLGEDQAHEGENHGRDGGWDAVGGGGSHWRGGQAEAMDVDDDALREEAKSLTFAGWSFSILLSLLFYVTIKKLRQHLAFPSLLARRLVFSLMRRAPSFCEKI